LLYCLRLHCYTLGVVVGLFTEEEEGIDIDSDVVQVKGGDPGTPGLIDVAFITS